MSPCPSGFLSGSPLLSFFPPFTPPGTHWTHEFEDQLEEKRGQRIEPSFCAFFPLLSLALFLSYGSDLTINPCTQERAFMHSSRHAGMWSEREHTRTNSLRINDSN
mmetsp:Transcript_29661/g.58225  ORF Transcript_29661/g.58225 Transcript_29661/m.58225 type:complete len:106 (+) Transcript_29661:992-1309(+)